MNKPILIILCGLPGSGKTTYAKKYIQEHTNTIHLSSDSIRAELLGDVNDQSQNGLVFTTMQQRAIDALNNGQDVIYDCTSITRKDRMGIINVCPKFAKIECHIIWAPIDTCIEQDAVRERSVGKKVIDKMLKRFQMPFIDEGIDEIKIIRPKAFDMDTYMDMIMESMDIPHDNPHHTLSVYDHCLAALHYAINHNNTGHVMLAAIMHDCGKPYTKSFTNTKGEITDIAHFYQHQCVGAWIACGMLNNIDVIWLISTHMSPFLNEKYYNSLPPYLKKMVDQLHEADLAAH